ncbi:MAG TPA: N-acetyltransferase family protein [Candidatus Limiplasma sp.]|nr:N-acetyltransferase family protein [Candidatus Limiplasma sp.]
MNTVIRIATKDDARFVNDVYGYYVTNTNVTFYTKNFSLEAHTEKIEKTLVNYPFYILEVEGVPCGFAYASALRPQDAYQWTVEATIYLSPDAPKRKGLGRMLYQKLLDTLQAQGFQTVFGVITGTNEASLQMHRSMGFAQAGRFHRMGNKGGAWLDVVWMEKTLAVLDDHPDPPIPFSVYTAQ